MSDGPKYQYHVLTWGGFYNTEYKAVHGLEPGDFLFDTESERSAFILWFPCPRGSTAMSGPPCIGCPSSVASVSTPPMISG